MSSLAACYTLCTLAQSTMLPKPVSSLETSSGGVSLALVSPKILSEKVAKALVKMPKPERLISPIHLNTQAWIEENEKFFLPPVCNKMMHNTQLKVNLRRFNELITVN